MYETKKDVNGTTTNNRVGHYDTQEQLMVQNSIELRVPVHNPADHNPADQVHRLYTEGDHLSP